jgi:cation diffusion facilitator CzcD-associated flavoprotein CzcO
MQSVDSRGKKVAVVGTGATGVQIIPKLAAAVKEMTVFQRTVYPFRMAPFSLCSKPVV